MTHEYNDADWQYEIDSVQRGGTTGQTRARRYGKVSRPDPTTGKKPHNQHSEKDGEDGFDADGIPTGI